MLALRGLLFSAAASTALLTNANADTPVSITYVPKSLAEASIASGPWTLHQAAGRNPHDASGIVPSIPTPYNPPTTEFGTPYAGYCMRGRVQTAQGFNPMQPYYFPFARPNGSWIQGFFDYRPRNQQESTVAAISTDLGKSWFFRRPGAGPEPVLPGGSD